MRIFINNILQLNKQQQIDDEENIHHITHVMRKEVGDLIEVVDRDNNVFKSKIESINPLVVLPLEELESNKSNINIDIYQGLPKFDKMEYIIEKSVELGVRDIYPVQMIRSVVKLDDKKSEKKIERWNKISESAAKQSKRTYIPIVKDIIKMEDINFNNYDLNIVLDTVTNKDSITPYDLEGIKEELEICKEKIKNISVIIGPEGGFDDKEREYLQDRVISIKLGQRIFRTETASIVILSILQYIFGDF